MAVREVAQKAGLEPLFRSQVRTKVEGLDVLDRIEGPVIFAANHASHLDTPLILLSLPDEWRRRTGVAAAADYFFDTWWRAVGSSLFFNTFPIDRRGGSMATTPGEVLGRRLEPGDLPGGDPVQGRLDGQASGWAPPSSRIEHGVPVVPVAHRGTFAAMPRGQGWPSPGRRQLTIRFGEPLVPGEGESVREFAPRIKAAVATLLDEDRSTWWEARRRASAGETPDPSGPKVATWRRVWEQSESPDRRRCPPAGSAPGRAPSADPSSSARSPTSPAPTRSSSWPRARAGSARGHPVLTGVEWHVRVLPWAAADLYSLGRDRDPIEPTPVTTETELRPAADLRIGARACPAGGHRPPTRRRPRPGRGARSASTGSCVALTIITLGFYTWYWYYKTHAEMKEHSGVGIGGPVALILAIFVGIVMPFLTSQRGRRPLRAPRAGEAGQRQHRPVVPAARLVLPGRRHRLVRQDATTR